MRTRSTFFVSKLARGHRTDRRRLRAAARHRAAVGLQVQRVCQPDRRAPVRAARRKPDARVPRRLALRRPDRSGPASSSNAGRCKLVREEMGLTNVQVMVPFVRTRERRPRRSSSCSPRTASSAARTGSSVIMMCELPTNALLAERYLEHFDGMSIGSNDMTQLTLGLDRDSAIIAQLVRRARRRGQGAAVARDPGVPQGRQIHRHLRPGAVRSSRLRALAASSRASTACR